MRKYRATRESSSSASSTDSSSNYQTLDSSIAMRTSSNLDTDLNLGLSISTTTSNFSPRQQGSANWPVKTLMRRVLITAEGEGNNIPGSQSSSSSSKRVMQMNNNIGDSSLFVKVTMEGSKIGRKIDVLALHSYPHLISSLEHMFSIPYILWAGGEQGTHQKRYSCSHVLTYQDQDGDWMMVGDVPWEMFLTAVKRLKITSI
ncbi:auxin-responsive protein IAA20-like [Apium graveolens]|uniref:auxin-responsive protein IAA20-like n=1 Tax=Apium graveolens TaxID=4045 RepID=UPI003D7907C1